MFIRRRQPQQIERRAAPRIDLRVEVSLESDHNLYWGVTHDLSQGGLFIQTYDTLPIGSEVTVQLLLPGRPEARPLRGRVQWVREPEHSELPPGIGVQLEGLDASWLRDLRRFSEAREPVFYE